jgi:hypothetical protein
MADYKSPNGPRVPGNTLRDYVERVQTESSTVDIVSKHIDFEFERDVADTFIELQSLLISKHNDYGPKNISDSPGGPLNGLRVRIHDKQARINNLIDNQKSPKHESLEDSFKDMANYAIIALLVLRGQWDR